MCKIECAFCDADSFLLVCDCPEAQPLCRPCIRIAVAGDYLEQCRQLHDVLRPDLRRCDAVPATALDLTRATKLDPVRQCEVNFDPWDYITMPWAMPRSDRNFSQHPCVVSDIVNMHEQDSGGNAPDGCTCDRPCRHYFRKSGCSKGATCIYCHDDSHRSKSQRSRRRRPVKHLL